MDAQRANIAEHAPAHEASLLADAHFSLAGERRLVLAGQGDPRTGSRYLAHRIIDNPRDLRAHVQRIYLLLVAGDEVTLRASIVDLFIVLGDKGHALKARMLDCATPVLSKTVAAFLRKHLHTGFHPWDNTISTMRMSLLSLGYIGRRELVRRTETVSPLATEAPLADAAGSLEYGQLEVPIETPEAANEAFPDDWEIVTALEEIHHHGDGDRYAQREPARPLAGEQQRLAIASAGG